MSADTVTRGRGVVAVGTTVVRALETGGLGLDESVALWERGEALADHCASWLDAAQQRITERVEARQGTTGTGSSAEGGPSAG